MFNPLILRNIQTTNRALRLNPVFNPRNQLRPMSSGTDEEQRFKRDNQLKNKPLMEIDDFIAALPTLNKNFANKIPLDTDGFVGVFDCNTIYDKAEQIVQALKEKFSNNSSFNCEVDDRKELISSTSDLNIYEIQTSLNVRLFHMLVAMDSDGKISYLHFSETPFKDKIISINSPEMKNLRIKFQCKGAKLQCVKNEKTSKIVTLIKKPYRKGVFQVFYTDD